MKFWIKVVLISMSVFSGLLMAACADKDKVTVEKIENFLQEKYGEEFVVDRIGGGYGTLTTNTVKAIVYPKESPYKKFNVEITKDTETIWDSYLNIIKGEEVDHTLNPVARKIFEGDLTLKTYLHSPPGFNSNSDSTEMLNIPLEDYLSTKIDVSIYVFVKSDGKEDVKNQADKMISFANRCLSFGIKEAYVRFFYLTPALFQEIEVQKDTLYQHRESNIYYSEKSTSSTWLQIKGGKVLQTTEEIISNFSE
ncbi:hypothetical protein LCL95_04130 [Bacillus timonensis]|nr:hypothetical protein [Bacillus timonensis]